MQAAQIKAGRAAGAPQHYRQHTQYMQGVMDYAILLSTAPAGNRCIYASAMNATLTVDRSTTLWQDLASFVMVMGTSDHQPDF